MNQKEGFVGDLGADLDAFNDETFGSGAIEDDWEASHTKNLETEVAITSVDSPRAKQVYQAGDEETLPSSLSNLTLKQLWPSSSNEMNSIWASPQMSAAKDVFPQGPIPQDTYSSPSHLPLHQHPHHLHHHPHQHPHQVPGPKMFFAEDLEKELTSEGSSSPAPSSAPTPPLDVPHPQPYPQHMRPPYFPPYLPLRGRVQFLPPGHPYSHLPLHQQGVWPSLPMPHTPPRQGMPLHFPLPHPPPGFMMRFPPMQPGPPHPHEFFHGHRGPHPHNVQESWRAHPPSRTSSRYSELLCDLKPDQSGFMTTKEKEWVLKIQLIQLQSPDPSNDDYYYQKFMQKKLTNEKRTAEPQHGLLLLPHITRESKEYRPVEFEGTLGKLSVQSVSAPRKVLEVSVAVDSDRDADRLFGREAKRRQVLLTIEKLYSIVLQMEELERKAAQEEVREVRERQLERKGQLCSQLVSLLRMSDESGDQVFQMIMWYRKGRRLLNRAISVLPDPKAYDVMLLLLKNLSIAVKKDANEPVLGECLVSARGVVRGLLFPQVVECLEAVLDGAQDGSIVTITRSKFGLCLLEALLDQGRSSGANNAHPLQQRWSTLCSKLHILESPQFDKLPTGGAKPNLASSLVDSVMQSVTESMS